MNLNRYRNIFPSLIVYKILLIIMLAILIKNKLIRQYETRGIIKKYIKLILNMSHKAHHPVFICGHGRHVSQLNRFTIDWNS